MGLVPLSQWSPHTAQSMGLIHDLTHLVGLVMLRSMLNRPPNLPIGPGNGLLHIANQLVSEDHAEKLVH